MTTAARPTFDSRRGVSLQDAGITGQISSRDMTGYTKLKWRDFIVSESNEQQKKQELEQREKEHFKKVQRTTTHQTHTKTLGSSDLTTTSTDMNYEEEGKDDDLDFDPRALLKRQPMMNLEIDADDDDDDAITEDEDISGNSRLNDDDASLDSEDETAELMRELEKIKRERAEEKLKKEQTQLETLEQQKTEAALRGNPLLDPERVNFNVKRRWDDDVVFKHQAKGVQEKDQRRFINDTLRSDFHRKFIERYIH